MYDVVIVGAGIVGLATAYQLQKMNPKISIALLEKEEEVASHQTGHNSGVIHSGVYYVPGTLKAKNCLSGRKELIDFCEQEKIPFKKMGKVIVARKESELPNLMELERRGKANGVEGVAIISKERLKEIEPHAAGIKALWVPNCAIVHYPTVAKAIAKKIEAKDGKIFLGQKVVKILRKGNAFVVRTDKDEVLTKSLINCAGAYSDRIAALALGKMEERIIPFRGEYYELCASKSHLVNGLIYPVNDPRFPFLGVHLTPMLDGRIEAGPNAVMAFSREGYKKTDVNLRDLWDIFSFKGFWNLFAKYGKTGFYEYHRSLSKKAFLRDLQTLVPAIEEKDLQPGISGVRAQVIARDGSLVYDFILAQEKNMIHVLNAPSRAATACFAVGRQIAEMAHAKFEG